MTTVPYGRTARFCTSNGCPSHFELCHEHRCYACNLCCDCPKPPIFLTPLRLTETEIDNAPRQLLLP